jgi:hypothetical protein
MDELQSAPEAVLLPCTEERREAIVPIVVVVDVVLLAHMTNL